MARIPVIDEFIKLEFTLAKKLGPGEKPPPDFMVEAETITVGYNWCSPNWTRVLLRCARPGYTLTKNLFCKPIWLQYLYLIAPCIKVPGHLKRTAGAEPDNE